MSDRTANAAPAAETLARSRGGYSLIEMMISMVIFSVGTLGFASTSVILERQVTMAAIDSDRGAAMTTAIERVRAIDFDSLRTGSTTSGAYTLSWTVTPRGLFTKEVQVVTTGPGMAPAAAGPVVVNPLVADTFEYQVIKP